MPTFEELKNRYMVTSTASTGGGSTIGSPPPPGLRLPIITGSDVDPLLDGTAYFSDLKAKLAALDTSKNAFCYFHGWWMDPAFSLDGPGASPTLIELMKQRSRAGVDVRAMGWVMAPEVMNSALAQRAAPLSGFFSLNNDTMTLLNDLRSEPTMAHKAVCNILSHPAAGAHLKMCVLGDDDQAYAYTGGLDFQTSRHETVNMRPRGWPLDVFWEDIQLRIKGPGARSIFNYFRDIWEEIRGRTPVSMNNPSGVTMSSHTSSMPTLASRSIGTSTGSKIHTQSARTLPQFNFTTGLSMFIPTNDPISFAPNGEFGIKAIWEKAISGGQKYIYIEDQSFWSTEISDWLNRQIKAHSELKVILLTGLWDPNDTPTSAQGKMRNRAINNHLCAGLSAAQRDRICFVLKQDRVIHAKTTIIDEHWASVGSNNYMRRSLYSDLESAVGFMDENGVRVGQYRQALWDRHFGAAEPDIDRAIARWFALPTTFGAMSGNHLQRVPLPMNAVTWTAADQTETDAFSDVDSRQAWGANVVSAGMNAGGGAISGAP